VQKYFYERCAGGPKSSDFWPTIKPFLSSKGVKTNNSITLSENNDIVNDRLLTKVGVTGLNVKVSVFVLGLFVFIACILGWFSSINVFGFPIFLATFMKKSLKIS
jgi:hypothetical protein